MTLYVSTLRIGIPSIIIALYFIHHYLCSTFRPVTVRSYTMRNFENVVIFVADKEREIERLNALEKKRLAMSVLGEYPNPEVARLLGYRQRGRAVPARCAGPALAGSSCGWFDGTITLSYKNRKTLKGSDRNRALFLFRAGGRRRRAGGKAAHRETGIVRRVPCHPGHRKRRGKVT
jgi:hypothetical protein